MPRHHEIVRSTATHFGVASVIFVIHRFMQCDVCGETVITDTAEYMQYTNPYTSFSWAPSSSELRTYQQINLAMAKRIRDNSQVCHWCSADLYGVARVRAKLLQLSLEQEMEREIELLRDYEVAG